MLTNAYIIVGPTASGKTTLSLTLAHQLDGEIVSADSRQIYRYMNIGTAKPLSCEMTEIPHHCINILNPDQDFSAGAYAKYTRPIIDDIFCRNKIPIIVGGSGLYIQALVDGFFPGDYKDIHIRNQLKRQIEEEGVQALYTRLCHIDPEAAVQIHCNDLKRIIRSLEVYEVSGRPMSQIQREETEPARFKYSLWGLKWERDVLYNRINKRVDIMIEKGLLNEVQNLYKMGYTRKNNSLDSVGYKELLDYLDGKIFFDEAVEKIKQNTRRFAKRQITWFKRDKRIQWLDTQEPVDYQYLSSLIPKLAEQELK